MTGSGKSGIIARPTGTGKTVVEYLILLLGDGVRVGEPALKELLSQQQSDLCELVKNMPGATSPTLLEVSTDVIGNPEGKA